MTKKIGLFGGTFDPIHFGHLNLALELMEKRALDQVWFIPAQINPFKLQTPPTSIDHRLDMVQLAIQDISSFYLKDVERERPPPSYMIHTLKALRAAEDSRLTSNYFYLLIGEDSIAGFAHWHLSAEIIRLVPLLIGSRSLLETYEISHFDRALFEAIQKGLTLTRILEISGSDIRKRLNQKLYCGHLVPLSVLRYIQQNQLYVF